MTNPRRVSIALAALALAVPAAAQCGYQSGTPQCFSFAPPPPVAGNVGEDLVLVSDKLKISGDIRFRTRNAWKPSGGNYTPTSANPNAGVGDQISSRLRINLDFTVNENITTFAQFNFSEVWPGGDAYSDADPNGNTNDFDGMAQAYLQAKDLLGLDETLRIGRSYFALASGLIYGSCDFLQFPAAGTGVWLSREFGAHKLEVFGIDNNGTITTNGLGNDVADGQRFVGAHARIDLGNELISALEPYVLFGTADGDRFNAAQGNPDFTKDSWYGLAAMGKIDRFTWNGEIAQRNDDVPTGSDNTFVGYRVNVLTDTADLTGNVLNRVRLTRTDSEGRLHINPGDFNSAGLLHQYGGAWRSDLSTDQLGLTFKPTETLSVDLAYLYMDSTIQSGGSHEVDLMIAKKLREGAHAWVGYGRDEDDRQVLFVQLTVFF
ncbi:MAG: hypothetical protein NTV21_04595 [Planctomycetota bacterium]|nr:hypothetical protein [Planctomycetota bacterium]